MQAKTPTAKASKGSVVIISSNDRLQLRFSFGGKRRYLSMGLPDIPINRRLAELKAAEIEKDILYERFDTTLQKYQSASSQKAITPTKTSQPNLDELWEKYSEFKKPQVSPSTYAKDFKRHRNHIASLPSRSLEEASAIRDWLLSHKSVNTSKRCLTQIKACCQWSMEEGLIDSNPFSSMKIQLPKGSHEDVDINPFTKEERDLIIQTFKSDLYYSYYMPYVQFLFFTGCRPSEAIALTWENITKNFIQFRKAIVISEYGLVFKEGLKTQTKRDFPINSEVREILARIRPDSAKLDSFIFSSRKNKFLDHHNFSSRAWKSILTKTGIPYRKSYQTRHTFITMCVEANMNSTVIGRWTGTSAKMIDKHYGATNFTNLEPPILS
jgi:integrase